MDQKRETFFDGRGLKRGRVFKNTNKILKVGI